LDKDLLKRNSCFLKPFERPRFPLPDFTRLRQDLLGAEPINRFHYFCQDPKPIPDTRQKWKLDLYIQNKEREWYILGGAGRQRQGTGKPFYLNLWENLDKIDLTQSERFEHWKRKAQRIQYKFRTRISNKGKYLASYHYNSGYNQRTFSREFHKTSDKRVLSIHPRPQLSTSVSTSSKRTINKT